jgi:hypothetical protein
MKLFSAIGLCLVLVAVLGRMPSQASSGTSVSQGRGGAPPVRIQGVWEAVEVKTTGPGARTIKPQPNLALFGATHYSRTQVSADRPRPALEDPATATADELRATWGPFVAEAGTYEIRGNMLTLRPIVAKNPAAVGSAIVYSLLVDGDAIRATSVSDRNGAVRYPETITLMRRE